MITITNKKIYHSDISLSDLVSMEHVKTIDMDEILMYLSDVVELGESVTFKRLFDIISENSDGFNSIYHYCLGGYPLEPFLQEIENNTTEKIESDILEVHWHCERWQDEDFTLFPSFHGMNSEKSESWALDFTSLNNLKDKLVKLNCNVVMYDYNTKQKDGKLKQLKLGKKNFTLFELYYSILFEITFHGGPLDKQKRWKELEDSVEELKVEKDNDFEESEYISFDDMIKKFDENDEYLVKFKKLRDHVSEKRITNKDNLDKLKTCLKEKLRIYDIISRTDENLDQYYKKLTDIEFNMQALYGEEEDKSFHRFWETPKCTCPKIDNWDIYPSDNPIFDKKCPIHRRVI